MALWAEPRHLSPSQQPCEWCKEEGPSCVTQHRARGFLLTSDQSGTREGLYSLNPSPLLFPVT